MLILAIFSNLLPFLPNSPILSISNKSNLRYFTFLFLLALVTMAFLGMISSFVLVIFWSTALAIIFWGTNQKITKKVRGKINLGALLTTVFILLGVVIPFVLITIALVIQSQDLYTEIQAGNFKAHQLADIIVDKVPFLKGVLERFQIDFESIRTTINASASNLAGTIANQIINYTQNILGLFVDFFMMIYLLFFFLRDGDQIVKAIGDVFPLGSEVEETLFYRFASVTRATLRGTLIVAIIQGFIGGVLFALVGIQAAVVDDFGVGCAAIKGWIEFPWIATGVTA